MSTSKVRALVSVFARRFCSAPSNQAWAPASPYKTPGPPVTRRRRSDTFASGPYELPGEPRPQYPKRKSPFKRTTALIKSLNEEEGLRLIKDGRAVFPKKIPNPRSGDLIRVTYVSTLAEKRNPQCFMGICMSVRNAGVGSTVVLRNVVDGVSIERGFPVYSPLIKDAEIVGKKKVRRNKLYYLRDKPLKESSFAGATKKPSKP